MPIVKVLIFKKIKNKKCLRFQLVVKWHVAFSSTFDSICGYKLAYHLCLHNYFIDSYMTPPSNMKWPNMFGCCVIWSSLVQRFCHLDTTFVLVIEYPFTKNIYITYDEDEKICLISRLTGCSTRWACNSTMHRHNPLFILSSVQPKTIFYLIWRCMLGCTSDQQLYCSFDLTTLNVQVCLLIF